MYEFLTPGGYIVGRIYPKGVIFKNYEVEDDHFRMGNYLAIQKSDPLITSMAGAFAKKR